MAKTEQLQIRVSRQQKARLARDAKRAGQTISAYVLGRSLVEAREEFGEVLGRLASGKNESFALATLNDLLSKWTGGELAQGVDEAPTVELSPFLHNYVAAMVELACSKKGIATPFWTFEVAALKQPYFATELASLRPYLLMASPVPFKRRNLFVDASVGDRV